MAAISELVVQGPAYIADSHRLLVAEDRLSGKCMQAAGFKYTSNVAPVAAGPFRPPDVTQIQRSGYGIHVKPGKDPNLIKLVGTDLAKYLSTYLGNDSKQHSIILPTGGVGLYATSGCLSDAYRTLYRDPSQHVYAELSPQFLRNDLAAEANMTGSYQKALNAWSICMRAGGQPSDSPQAAHDAAAAATGPNALQAEIRIALLDAACDSKSDLTAVRVAAALDTVPRLPPATLQWLQRCVNIRSTALSLAADLRL